MKKTILSFFIFANIGLFGQDTFKTSVLNDVVFLGIRGNKKTPITQKNIDRQKIDSLYNGQEVPIFLNKTPSTTSTSDGGHSQGYTYFRLRGIDQTRINMTLNGAPLNEPEDQGVYTSNYPMFLNNIKTIQIQRGVGTSTNGVSSFAGSINFESENGVDKKLMVELGYGSWNTRRASVSYGSGLLKRKFAIFTSLSAYGTDGYKYHSGGTGYSAFLNMGYYGDKDKFSFTGFTGLSINKMAWLAVAESDINKDPRTNANTNGDNDNFKQTLLQLQHTHTFLNKLKISSTLFYNRLDGNWGMDMNSIGAGTDTLNYGLHSNFFGAISNLNYTSKKVNFNFGVSGNAYNRQHTMRIFPNIDSLIYKNTGYKYEFSTFAKAGFDFWKFTLYLDAQYRYVYFKYAGDVRIPNIQWNFFNPKGGLIFNQNEHVNYYFSIGLSHREPTRSDMFGGNDNLTTFVHVVPEQVLDYELGANVNYNKIKIQSNVFYMDFKNEITLQGALGANGLPLMNNVSKSFRSGIEFDFDYQISKMFNMQNNMTYSYNRIVTDNGVFQPLLTPNFIINQSFGWNYKGFTITANAKCHSTSYLDLQNTQKTPAFVVFGLKIQYQYENFTFIANCVNVTNQKYYTGGYVITGQRYLFVNEPASFYFTLKIKI